MAGHPFPVIRKADWVGILCFIIGVAGFGVAGLSIWAIVAG